jgi:hypothetical protein
MRFGRLGWFVALALQVAVVTAAAQTFVFGARGSRCSSIPPSSPTASPRASRGGRDLVVRRASRSSLDHPRVNAAMVSRCRP